MFVKKVTVKFYLYIGAAYLYFLMYLFDLLLITYYFETIMFQTSVDFEQIFLRK